MKQQIFTALLELGLDELEASIYWELLQKPEITILEISQNLATYRRKIYEGLDKLNHIGLVEKLDNFNSKKPNYRAKSPVVIQTLIKAKQHHTNKSLVDFQEVLPNLLTNFFEVGKVPEVRIFDGENKFKYLLNIILDEVPDGTNLLGFNEGDDLFDLFDPDYFINVWVEKRIAKNCFAKVLVNADGRLKDQQIPLNSQKLREVRILNNTKSDTSAFWIIGNKVIFWDTQSIKAVLIENQEIARLMTQIWQISWETNT